MSVVACPYNRYMQLLPVYLQQHSSILHLNTIWIPHACTFILWQCVMTVVTLVSKGQNQLASSVVLNLTCTHRLLHAYLVYAVSARQHTHNLVAGVPKMHNIMRKFMVVENTGGKFATRVCRCILGKCASLIRHARRPKHQVVSCALQH